MADVTGISSLGTPAPPAPALPPAHQAAAARLRHQYAAIPTGTPVRLAKRTSNLFRYPRRAVTGLDVSGLPVVLSIDPVARTAIVGGMTTYEDLVDATLPLRADAAGRPPAEDDHARRRGLRARDRVILPAQRPAPRVGTEMDVLTGDGRLITAAPTRP